ncbi:hypothetical protein CDD80_3992 [Ophiocordyceps camponoti-rufipedis]|uniref:NmrA-like domain-containing protein n=1 Tax=Ophiocordyceps camponoti-rufipedis TaxID=2004952 RepID=A0A2C5YZI3_9HYPO|nr:hypothetical protein CDD80_3992 [Ophiocordyceps camponoti-rufipedis]
MASQAKTIAVFGATGKQGGAVARSLLANKAFVVRAITRNPASDASRALAEAGAHVVQADGFDGEQMRRAFDGCWGAFVNLNSDDPLFRKPGAPTEVDLGKTIVDAAVAAGVEHFVFSSGPPCVEMTDGKVNMKAMESKYKIETYARQLGRFKTLTAINAAWYLENFLDDQAAPIFGGFPFFPDDDGYLTMRAPHWGGSNEVPFVSMGDDYGDIVQGIFLEPERYDGRVIHGASFMVPFEKLVAAFEEATGKKARYEPLLPDWEAFDTKGIPELDDVKLMFAFTQTTGGLYFDKVPSETATATELKRISGKATSRSEELVRPKEWFAKHFATSS